VKCICIDPPYNTGNQDFVYNDRYVDKEDSWRYSKWLEFMYRRIRLAKDLLANDGVLMICINEESRAKLELMLDQVLPGMRVGSFVWRVKDTGNNEKANFSSVHEYILVYANKGFNFAGKALVLDKYRNPDGDIEGAWAPVPLTCRFDYKERKNLFYPIQDPKTGYWYPCDPERVWVYSTESRLSQTKRNRSETIEDLIERGIIYFPPCKESEVMQWESMDSLLDAIRKGKGPRLPKKKTPLLKEDLPNLDFWIGKPISPCRPSRKSYLKDKKDGVAPVGSWIGGQNEEFEFDSDDFEDLLEMLRTPRGGEGTDALKDILGNKAFSHPKPPTLIKHLIRQSTSGSDIVMDFFAGSGTTAQAVLELNQEDENHRRFIMVSSTEATETEPDKNICREVCAKRIKGVIDGYNSTPGL